MTFLELREILLDLTGGSGDLGIPYSEVSEGETRIAEKGEQGKRVMEKKPFLF